MDTDILKGRKILIVEDDFSSRLYLNKILEKSGAVLFTAEDGQSAVDIVTKNPDMDVVLMDIRLPIMNGYEATEKIKAIDKNIIVIAQTAYGLIGDKEKIIASGFNDYINKPIFQQNLTDKIINNLALKNKI